ncbi:MAG TPA: Spy/CpxP family protein refolding chaperone [Longimicrobiales bacterium]|nr:Spy/CpxP family protein refolding chaperone [Longimicrobiales bacterium]
MNRNILGALALSIAFAAPAFAQQPPPPPRPRQPMRGMQEMPGRPGMPGMAARGQQRFNVVEAALRMKTDLKLTDAQASQLEAIRKEIVAERQAHARDMIDVQSRIAAGLVKPEDVRKQFEGNRDATQKTMEARRDRIEKILTQEQRDQMRQHVRHAAMRQMRMRQGRGGMQGRGRMQGQRMRRRGGFDRGFEEE